MDNDSNVSLVTNNDKDLLEEAMKQELGCLSILSSKCSIYRVPERLRGVNENAYRPKVVSVGPFHHGEAQLQAMEEHKMRYLNDLLCEAPNLSLGSYIEVVWKKEKDLLDCYAETIGFDKDKFVKIILVDAAFVIGFLRRQKDDDVAVENDRIFRKPWMIRDVWLDMLLLENQLPFFILKDVYDHHMTASGISGGDRATIFDLSYNFFKELMHLEVEGSKLEKIRSYEIKHFVDFLRYLYLPLPLNEPQESATIINTMEPHGLQSATTSNTTEPHGLQSATTSNTTELHGLQSITTPNITKLHQAGVRFGVGSRSNLFDLQFENGRLEIPKLVLGEETKISIRNLVAFEQCNFQKIRVNDYVVIMSRLVSTPKDVDLMVKYGIIQNKLGNNKEGSLFINNLAHGVALDYKEFCFAGLCEELSNYCKNPCHEWMENLRQKYFNTPWAIIIFIAGAITLTLGFIQAVCSVLSLKSSNPNGHKT